MQALLIDFSNRHDIGWQKYHYYVYHGSQKRPKWDFFVYLEGTG